MKDRIGTIDDEIAEQEAEEAEVNPMKVLEERTKESRQEMDILDALEEIKDANARSAKMDVEDVLATKAKLDSELKAATAARLKAEEDAAVAAAFGGVGKRVKRLDDVPPPDGSAAALALAATAVPADAFDSAPAPKRAKAPPRAADGAAKRSVGALRADRLGLVKRKPSATEAAAASAAPAAAAVAPSAAAAGAAPSAPKASGGGLAGLVAYGSDSDSD